MWCRGDYQIFVVSCRETGKNTMLLAISDLIGNTFLNPDMFMMARIRSIDEKSLGTWL